MTIDISSRLAPLPHLGVWARVFGNRKKKLKRRRLVGKDGEEVSESMVPSPTEGSVEEAVAITSSGGNFWIWVLRAMLSTLR